MKTIFEPLYKINKISLYTIFIFKINLYIMFIRNYSLSKITNIIVIYI